MAVYLFILSLLFFGTPAFATDLPIRGIASGEAKIKAGDSAPLITPELEKANKGGKVIVLMLGYQSHCPWCDRMERYVNAATQ